MSKPSWALFVFSRYTIQNTQFDRYDRVVAHSFCVKYTPLIAVKIFTTVCILSVYTVISWVLMEGFLSLLEKKGGEIVALILGHTFFEDGLCFEVLLPLADIEP